MEWCHSLTLPIRERATHSLLVQLRAFAQSFSAFVEGTPGVLDKDRTTMKQQWESVIDPSSKYFKHRSYREALVAIKRRTRAGVTWRLVKVSALVVALEPELGALTCTCRQDFIEVVKNRVCELQDAFADDLCDKCAEGEVHVSVAFCAT